MAYESAAAPASSSEGSTTPTRFFSLGADLFQEVQQIVGHSKVKSLRLTLGGRFIKDIPVSPATAVATIALAVLAVVISNLRVEVVKDTDLASASLSSTPASSAPGGAL